MISQELLKILVCPETHQALHLGDLGMVSAVNDRIRAGSQKRRDGQAVSGTVDAVLVREDNRVAYLVRQGIPVMLVDESIALNG